jgi:hypothetical protein
MYDVIFIDDHGDETPVAEHLADRAAAAALAKQEAAQRGAGRMVLPGSGKPHKPHNCVCVIPAPLPEAA